MMRHTNLSNTLSMFITLSAIATGMYSCADHIVVGNRDLLDAGTEITRDHDAAPETVDADATQNETAPFTIGCNDSHDLTPAVNPHFTGKYAAPGSNACVIAVDSAAELVAACASTNPTTVGVDALPVGQNRELFVQKRGSDGSVIFNTPLAGLSPLDIATSASGDTFVLGAMNPASDADPAFGLAKLTSTGAIAWNKKFYKLYDTTTARGALIAANDGTVWVTGSTNFAAAQFDGAGNELQRIMVASDGNPGWGSAQAIRTLSNGDILIAGILNRPVDFGGGMLGAAADALSSGFLARFTPSGQYVTSQFFGLNTGVDGIGLGVGADGSIVLTGNLNGVKSIFGCTSKALMAPGFVAKLDDALSVQWATLIPAGIGSPEIDPQGNILLATKTPANVYLVRLDPSGNAGTAWWTRAGAAAGYRSALAPNGAIYVSGSFLESVSFDDTPLTTTDNDAAGFIVGITP